MTRQNQYGITYNLKRIRRIMKKFRIICPIRKAHPARRNFKQGVAGKVLLTDINYLTYRNGKRAYLTTVKDAETNEILVYEVSTSLHVDNAPQESFFGHFKDETNLKECETLEEVKREIKRYMTYYNHYRGHWNLKKLPPVKNRQQLQRVA